MSIGNLKDSGNQGTNFPYQLKSLKLLSAINGNVALGATEATLQLVLSAIQDGQDFEAKIVVDDNGNGTTYLEVRIWNPDTQSWETPLYYLPGSNVGVPASSLIAPIIYINNGAVLAQIYTELLDQGITLDDILVAIGDILNTVHLEVDDDAIAVEQLLPTNINLLYGAFEGEGTEWERIQTDGNGRLKGIQDIIDELQATLDVNVTNATLAVTQSGAWTITSNQGTSPWVVSGTVALDAATLAALETITVNQGTSPWTVDGTVNAAQSGVWTVALDAATLAALETITVDQGTSPWIIGDGGGSITVDGTVAATQSGTWDINNISGTISLPTGAATETTLALVNSNTVLGNITLNGIDTKLAAAARTHNTISATGAGSVPAGSMCGSVLNVGNTAGTWNGISLPAGVSIPWAQIANRDTYGTISYDATGTTFIIEYTT